MSQRSGRQPVPRLLHRKAAHDAHPFRQRSTCGRTATPTQPIPTRTETTQ